jgi:uncharacterized protein
MSSIVFGSGVSHAPHHHHHQPYWRRKTIILSRWLHIYLSMCSFAILFFFAVTGLTLNHQDWFANQERTVQVEGAMDVKYLGKNVAKMEIVEFLRKTHAIRGAVSDFRIEDSQCTVDFKGPGYEADVLIDRGTGRYELTETRQGVIGVLNDLHKGRDSGRGWAAIIDIAAILMILVSLTGLMILFFLQKRRFSGLLAAVLCALLFYLAYLAFVP